MAEHLNLATDFGAVGTDSYTTPGPDTAPAWAAAMAALAASTWGQPRTLFIPNGRYRFANPPAPVPVEVAIKGELRDATVLRSDFEGNLGPMLLLKGGAGYGGGSLFEDFDIWCTAGRTPGRAISMSSGAGAYTDQHFDDAVTAILPDYCAFKRIGITSGNGGLFSCGIYANGMGRYEPAGPQGLRATTFDDVLIWDCRDATVDALNVVDFKFRGGGLFGGSGATPNAYVSGAPGGRNSTCVLFTDVNGNGALDVGGGSIIGRYTGAGTVTTNDGTVTLTGTSPNFREWVW